tara:strand:+ start:584 stop:820 length:237 start_codon:yes stop_codon:yes gene_type:complete
MKNIYSFNVKYKTAAEYNSVNKKDLPVEVTDFPKIGDRYLTYTVGTAHTNSALTACIGVYGLASSVPFKHINGIEVEL